MQKTEEVEDMKKEEDVSEQEYEDDEEEARGEGRRPKYEVDKAGNHIICTVCYCLLPSWMFVDLCSRFSISCMMQNIEEGENLQDRL